MSNETPTDFMELLTGTPSKPLTAEGAAYIANEKATQDEKKATEAYARKKALKAAQDEIDAERNELAAFVNTLTLDEE